MYLRLFKFILIYFGIISASNINREGFQYEIQKLKEEAGQPQNITGGH